MVSSENTIQKTVYFLESDLSFLDSLHNDNLNEAVRIALKRLRIKDYRSIMVQYVQFIIFGVILLGISGLLPVNDVRSWGLFVIGIVLFIFGFINILYTVIIGRRKSNNDLET